MVEQPTTETGEGLPQWSSRLLQWSSGLPEDAKFTVPVVTNTTNTTSRTTSDESLLPSNEGNKALREKNIQEGKYSVPMKTAFVMTSRPRDGSDDATTTHFVL
jgi:hypothetical protein